MTSTPSSRLLLELQASGENLNTWGEKLLVLFQMLEAAIRGVTQVTVNTAASLASSNYTETDATNMVLDLAGSGGTLTIPAREAVYLVRNGGAASITLTTGSGVTSAVEVNAITLVFCDGVNVRQLGAAGLSLKGYIDQQLLAASAGNLPGQPGNAGKYLKTDGANATWQDIAVAIANVAGFPAQSGNAGKLLTTDGAVLSWLALATAAEVMAAASKLFTAATAFAANESVDLDDAATVATKAGLNFTCTLGANGRTIGAPAGWTAGQSGRFALTTGGAWSINWHASYKKVDASNWPSTFAAGGPHLFGYYYDNGVVELSYAGQRAA